MACSSAIPFSKFVRITLQAISLFSVKMKILSSIKYYIGGFNRDSRDISWFIFFNSVQFVEKNGQVNRLVLIFEIGATVWEILDEPVN